MVTLKVLPWGKGVGENVYIDAPTLYEGYSW